MSSHIMPPHDPDCRSGFFVDGEASERNDVCTAVAALKRAGEQFGEVLLAYSTVDMFDSGI